MLLQLKPIADIGQPVSEMKGREDLIIQPCARPVHYDCPALPALLALRPVDITLPVHHDACPPPSPLPPSLVLAHHHNVIIQPSALPALPTLPTLPALCPADISITAITDTTHTSPLLSSPPLPPSLILAHQSRDHFTRFRR